MADHAPSPSPYRLIEINLDEASIGRNAPEVEHERQVAIFDLLEENFFHLTDGPAGPYKLGIALAGSFNRSSVLPRLTSAPAWPGALASTAS